MLNRYNKLVLILSFFGSLFAQDHFVVDLEDTGTTQLTIFSDSITGLQVGDEIGIFDENAITNYNDCTNEIGELLVGAGVWDGSQLNLVSVGSVDMCAFGGVQVSGYVEGNPVIVKVWRGSEMIEYDTELTWSAGTGSFGDVIQNISEITLADPYACEDGEVTGFDDCNAAVAALGCDFVFAGSPISEWCPVTCDNCPEVPVWGCMDESACNYDASATMNTGCEFAEEYYDCEGVCLNDSDSDEVCDELEIVGCMDDTACNYDETATDDGNCWFAEEGCTCEDGEGAVVDCAGECGGDAYLVTLCEDTDGDGQGNPGSETEECVGGDSTISDGCDLPDLNIFLGSNGEVFYNSSVAIAGFQFDVDGASATSASGGDADDAGFSTTPGATVLGFSFTGESFGPGCGVITNLEFDGEPTGLSGLVFSDSDGNPIEMSYFDGEGGSDLVEDCTDEEPDCATNDTDCAGVCGGDSIIDNCDECVSPGNECEADCNGDLGGTAFLDDCEVCVGGNTGLEENATMDECGDCYENGDNDPNWNVSCSDCNGIPNGDWIEVELCHDLDMDGLGDPDDTIIECVEPPQRDDMDGCELPENNIYLNSDGSVVYNSSSNIGGFQFNVDGDGSLTNVSGGDAGDAGFMISTAGSMALGFSMTGANFGPCGTMVIIDYDGVATGLSGFVISDAIGDAIDFVYYEEPTYEEWTTDCSDEFPDCAANYYDCADECGGDAVEDECGVCGGDGPEEHFDCDGNCISEEDECGVCGGDGSTCSPQYYVVELENTGVTQLTIFTESISSLQIGDEIGIFDENAITNYNNCDNILGELLVGSGVWNGSQLNVVSIGSADTCPFGGVQVAGYVEGNPLTIRVYRASTDTEFSTEITWGAGTGNFGDIIQSINELQLVDNSGGIIGCMDDTACNYDADATIAGDCDYAEENHDCDGFCIVEVDCLGECGGSAEVDECGICGGDGDGDGTSDFLDNCGVCLGDDSSCTGCMDDTACNYDSNAIIEGDCDFADEHYDCDGNCESDTDADGVCDELEIAGCTDENSCNYNPDATDDDGSCDGGITNDCDYCLDGSIVDNDSDDDGTCDDDTIVVGCMDDTACNYDASANINSGCEFAEEYYDCDGNCESDTDADGVCDELEVSGCTDENSCNFNADATDDDGSCDGGPTDTNYDCDGNCLVDVDCLGECGGAAANDNCDVCDDDPENDCVEDCAGEWGGNAVEDECGVCNGDGIADGACDCDGTLPPENFDCYGNCLVDVDCLGECGGTAIEDECGICNGDGILDGACDCEGTIPEEYYDCDGNCESDSDGDEVCDELEVVGCQDMDACNYDETATDAGECTYAEVNYDCDGNCIAAVDYCGECGGDNSSCASNPAELTVEEWSATGVYTFDETCAGESSGFAEGPFSFSGYDCESLTISFSTDGSFNGECGTSLVPVPIPGNWAVYGDDMICLTVGDESECGGYMFYDGDSPSFGIFGFLEGDENCYETEFVYSSSLSIDEYGIPTEFAVHQNYPNPFNPSTTIEFDVATPESISLVVYDLTGKEVFTLASGYHVPGRYSVVWNAVDNNGEQVSSGMYIYQLRTSEAVITKKLVLLR